ncbi:hypothetical protein H310_13083 [Aphanomyces invadans]|uniref:Ribosomal RNA methyltransferase FtsJ domain-containing protein n=1 Tax=Aphanomyces invadans TaxID=157072 RepID=A0A024TF44_9STRA|nr:hypothetical protein H310_13083 [Aphanomyces invadans]ETV92634.1 hypothetical protein H310_13083 [Aphanomyces invadans]|eukprot:XP_008878670.1 hypothetical protein H310_13083 [Aphanomyces invadans]
MHAFQRDKPLVVVHVEATQVERFRSKLDKDGVASGGGTRVVLVDNPLLFVQCDGLQSQARVEHMCGGGRIAAHRLYIITSVCLDPSWMPHSHDLLPLQRTSVFRVVAYPNHLQTKLVDLLHEHGYATHPTKHTHELHVVAAPRAAPYFYFGVLAVVSKAPPTPSEAGSTVVEAIPCRAYFKLQEACRGGSMQLLPPQDGFRAIDIGASPGGWTSFLSRNGASCVVAVDPGMLTIPVDGVSIIHLNMLVEAALPQLSEMELFDLCVCDINVRPRSMAKLIRSVLPFLTARAKVILTLKLGRRPTETAVQQAVCDVQVELGRSFGAYDVRWLHANTINERTLVAELL